MGNDASKPATEKATKRSRSQREEEVRRKYDFSVIRTLRQERGLTIEKFAKLCGLSYAPISRIETNLIKPNLETLDKIAEGLGVTTYNLVAMAEKREAEKIPSQDFKSGGFSFRTFSFEGISVSYGTGKKGAEADDLDIRKREYENVIVQSGALDVTVNDKVFRIGPGESLQYDRIFPRKYKAVEDSELIVVSHSKH